MVKIAALAGLALISGPVRPQASPLADLAQFPRASVLVEGGAARHEFQVWLADTPARRGRGLMFVRALPKDAGMLFLFDEPRNISMWMKNTFIPLDMLFIAADGRIVRIAQRTRPHSSRTIESRVPALAVLEIAGGECQRRGITVGDRVHHPALSKPRPSRAH